MTNRVAVILIASSSFTGGVALGLLAASKRGRVACSRLADVVQAQSRLMQARLHEVQDQVRALERQVEQAGHDFTDRLAHAGENVLTHYLPALPEEAWEVHRDELARELPHLPRL